jgi:hypothetical protein
MPAKETFCIKCGLTARASGGDSLAISEIHQVAAGKDPGKVGLCSAAVDLDITLTI